MDAGKPKYIINFSGTHPVVAYHTDTDIHTAFIIQLWHIIPTLTYTLPSTSSCGISYWHWHTHCLHHPVVAYHTDTDIHTAFIIQLWRIIPTMTYTLPSSFSCGVSYRHWHTHCLHHPVVAYHTDTDIHTAFIIQLWRIIPTLTYTLPSSTTARQILEFQNLKSVYWNTDWHCIVIFCFKILYLLMMHTWLAVTLSVELWYIVSTLTHILPSTTTHYGISHQHWHTYCRQQQLIYKNTYDCFHYNTPAGITISFHFQVKTMENHYDFQNCYKTPQNSKPTTSDNITEENPFATETWQTTCTLHHSLNFMFYWPCIPVQLWVNDQLDTQLYKTFIIIILYVFRATLCSLSGGRIVLIQQLI